MATGLDDAGEAVVPKNLSNTLVKMCQGKEISNEAKLRLLMIYLISQGGIQDSTRKALMKSSPRQLERAVLNLSKLGVDLSQAYKGSKSKHSKQRLAEFEKRAKTIPLALMRYIPALQSILQDLVKPDVPRELNDAYPYTQDSQDEAKRQGAGRKSVAAASARGHWRGGGRDKPDEKEDLRPRFIVYVLGGITFSELRSVYEIANSDAKTNLLCGSAGALSPSKFIQGLSEIPAQEFEKLLTEDPEVGAAKGKDDDDDDE
jgi:hypothetical protein